MRAYDLLQIVVGILAVLALYAGNIRPSINSDSQSAGTQHELFDEYVPSFVSDKLSSSARDTWGIANPEDLPIKVFDYDETSGGWSLLTVEKISGSNVNHPDYHYRYSLIVPTGMKLECFLEDRAGIMSDILPVESFNISSFNVHSVIVPLNMFSIFGPGKSMFCALQQLVTP